MRVSFPQEGLAMSLSYRIEHGIVFTTASGEVTPEENHAFTQGWLSDPDLPVPLRVCRDSRQITPPTAKEIQNLASLNKNFRVPDSSRLAIVADRDAQYGMSRMYEALVDGSNYSVAVFRDLDDAVAWLWRYDRLLGIGG
jgi:hypothetical protein